MPTLPRCPFPGCPIRWSAGADRPCRDHDATADIGSFASQLGIDIGMAATPGFPTADSGGDRADLPL